MLKEFKIDPATPTIGKHHRSEEIDYDKNTIFTEEDLVRVKIPHHDAIVITVEISNLGVDNLLVD